MVVQDVAGTAGSTGDLSFCRQGTWKDCSKLMQQKCSSQHAATLGTLPVMMPNASASLLIEHGANASEGVCNVALRHYPPNCLWKSMLTSSSTLGTNTHEQSP